MPQPHHRSGTVDPGRMEQSALLLMAVSQHWGESDHAHRLQAALDVSRSVWSDMQATLSSDAGVPSEIRNNLLIVSVYAEGKLDEIARSPSQDKLASLIELTRNLALSLKEWRSTS